jgi:hypothetical protein
MAKLVKLINKTGHVTELDLVHAQSVLQIQVLQGREDWKLDSKVYIFDNNVIKRKPNNKSTKKAKEQQSDLSNDEL